MKKTFTLMLMFVLYACNTDDHSSEMIGNDPENHENQAFDFSDFFNIDFSSLFNYEDQYIPVYITQDNMPSDNAILNEVATLGRVLFYDTNLSTTNTVSCSSCHKQSEAFGDTDVVSTGVNGITERHAMRLINIRFSSANKFFWNKRVRTLEEVTTRPIQDHIEMGFSGQNGDQDINDLIVKLENTAYYKPLFEFAFGNANITQERIQNALAQFIRSIQSFDSKYDEGRLTVSNAREPFENFTQQENNGKELFFTPAKFNSQGSRISGGVGCETCHRGSEFSIDFNSKNNGVIDIANGTGTDLTNTRAPTLRNIIKANGSTNGPLMHTGAFTTLNAVLDHYNEIDATGNNNLDIRLKHNGNGQQLNLTQEERDALISFLRTLAGNEIYTAEKWSNPFL